MSSPEDLPPALPAMWRALRRGYDAEPGLLVVAFGLSLLAAVPDALLLKPEAIVAMAFRVSLEATETVPPLARVASVGSMVSHVPATAAVAGIPSVV